MTSTSHVVDTKKETASLEVRAPHLESFAEKKYAVLEGVTRKSDDEQEEFTSKAENWLTGARITMLAALRSARVAEETYKGE